MILERRRVDGWSRRRRSSEGMRATARRRHRKGPRGPDLDRRGRARDQRVLISRPALPWRKWSTTTSSTAPAGTSAPGPRRVAGLRVRRASSTDPGFLSEVVRFDLPRLGDISGLRRRAPAVPHRHRHALARPARRADDRARLLRPPLAQARELARRAGPDVEFVEAELYDAVAVLGAGAFDLVFTGIGALCWLPAVSRWAQVVADSARSRRPPFHPRGTSCSVVARL